MPDAHDSCQMLMIHGRIPRSPSSNRRSKSGNCWSLTGNLVTCHSVTWPADYASMRFRQLNTSKGIIPPPPPYFTTLFHSTQFLAYALFIFTFIPMYNIGTASTLLTATLIFQYSPVHNWHPLPCLYEPYSRHYILPILYVFADGAHDAATPLTSIHISIYFCYSQWHFYPLFIYWHPLSNTSIAALSVLQFLLYTHQRGLCCQPPLTSITLSCICLHVYTLQHHSTSITLVLSSDPPLQPSFSQKHGLFVHLFCTPH